MGGFDAHYGAVGSGIRTGTLVKIIGTSTCDCAIAPVGRRRQNIPGICGIVDGSIMPGYYGIEAGQSAVGDILRWWVEGVCEGSDCAARRAVGRGRRVTARASRDCSRSTGTTATAPCSSTPRLTGLILGQTLHTTRAEIYRALIEATAFGARAIIERMREYGVPIERVVCCGGIAEKNDLFMQIYADVIGQPMLIAGSPQTPALGRRDFRGRDRRMPRLAATTTGRDAQDRMTSLKERAVPAGSGGARRLR